MDSLSIVTYHYVRNLKDSMYPNLKGLETASFKRQLDYLMQNYNIIRAEDIIESVKFGIKLPENSCLLTFDDGYKDHLNFVLPELLKRKIQGSFFVINQPVIERKLLDVNKIQFILECCDDISRLIHEIDLLCLDHGINLLELMPLKDKNAITSRYDNPNVAYVKKALQSTLPKDVRNQICKDLFKSHIKKDEFDFADELYLSFDDTKNLIDNGMYVGGHGYSHELLGELSTESQLLEINHSLKFLANIGAVVEDWIMCYPHGSYNKTTLKILKDHKCIIGLTTDVGKSIVSQNNGLELARYNTNDFPQ